MTYRRGAGGSSCAFATVSAVLARCSCCNDLRLASLRVHRCAILFAISGGTVGAISMVGLNFTVDLRVVLGSCSST
jgi:hypothetical protein